MIPMNLFVFIYFFSSDSFCLQTFSHIVDILLIEFINSFLLFVHTSYSSTFYNHSTTDQSDVPDQPRLRTRQRRDGHRITGGSRRRPTIRFHLRVGRGKRKHGHRLEPGGKRRKCRYPERARPRRRR